MVVLPTLKNLKLMVVRPSKLNCFLACRTDIDARDNLERTALHLASIEGHPEIVQLLLQFRALDSVVDVYG